MNIHAAFKPVVSTLLATALSLASTGLAAITFDYPKEGDTVIGRMQSVELRYEDTLSDVARRYSVGYQEIRGANPDIDYWLPGDGTGALVPTRFVLPDVPHEGLVLNIAELRLYYFPPADPQLGRQVVSFPVSIGRMDWETPLGKTTIISKRENPTWTPPASIRKEHAEQGDILPDVVPGGPDNPLGQHALYLGRRGYLIHGTNRPYGIGMRVTHGCMRLYPENVAELFERVPVGTAVNIIDEPYKAGWQNGVLYLEAHPLFDGDENRLPTDYARLYAEVEAKAGEAMAYVDRQLVDQVAEEASGIPVPLYSSGESAGAQSSPF